MELKVEESCENQVACAGNNSACNTIYNKNKRQDRYSHIQLIAVKIIIIFAGLVMILQWIYHRCSRYSGQLDDAAEF